MCLSSDPRVLPQITEEVGRCGPMARTVDSAAVILCSQMVDSLVSADPLTNFIHPENADLSPFLPSSFSL